MTCPCLTPSLSIPEGGDGEGARSMLRWNRRQCSAWVVSVVSGGRFVWTSILTLRTRKCALELDGPSTRSLAPSFG